MSIKYKVNENEYGDIELTIIDIGVFKGGFIVRSPKDEKDFKLLSSITSYAKFRKLYIGKAGDTVALSQVHVHGTIVTQTATENIDVIAGLYVSEPNITDNLTGDITVAASIYILNTPTEGETNAAIYIASGDSNMNGTSYLKLPIHDTNATLEGSIWYDASEDKLKFKTGAGVGTITSS